MSTFPTHVRLKEPVPTFGGDIPAGTLCEIHSVTLRFQGRSLVGMTGVSKLEPVSGILASPPEPPAKPWGNVPLPPQLTDDEILRGKQRSSADRSDSSEQAESMARQRQIDDELGIRPADPAAPKLETNRKSAAKTNGVSERTLLDELYPDDPPLPLPADLDSI